MDPDKIERDHLVALFRFAWALSGDDSAAVELTQLVLADDSWHLLRARGTHATDLALFTLAYRLFTGGEALPIPPAHDRVAILSNLSLQYASDLSSDSLLKSFLELELPQRAALVLFYTTKCSLQDIAEVLHRTTEEAMAVISRGKAEWLHILKRGPEDGNSPKEGE